MIVQNTPICVTLVFDDEHGLTRNIMSSALSLASAAEMDHEARKTQQRQA